MKINSQWLFEYSIYTLNINMMKLLGIQIIEVTEKASN